jgi:hypothetical protein
MDDDILSQGDDREPRPWPRRLGVIAALVLVGIAGTVYLVLPHHPHSATAAPPPTAAATAPAGVIPSPITISGNLVISGQLAVRDGIVIRSLPWSHTLRLPVTGRQPAWYSPATGRFDPVGGLPAESAGYQFTRVDGGWAVQANSAGKVACGGCGGFAMPVWFLADGARSATRVGLANLIAPAASVGALWLTSYPPDANTSASAAGRAREVGPTGTLLGPPVTLPAGYVIQQGTDRGLLLSAANPGTGADRLWKPGSPQAGRTLGHVIAANATEIASAPRCASTCSVQVLDLATGRDSVVRLPAASTATYGAFSPSGGYLALQVISENVGDDGSLAVQLDVASVASGRVTVVQGTLVSGDDLAGFGWPNGSDRLVAEFNFESKTQLASWRPGASELALAVVKPANSQTSLIVG